MEKIQKCACVLLMRNEKSGSYIAASTRMVPVEKGKLQLPGGRFNGAELPELCAGRELTEEIGVVLGNEELFPLAKGMEEFSSENKRFWVHFYGALWNEGMGEPHNIEPDKQKSVGWYEIKRIIGRNGLSLGLEEAMETYQEWLQAIKMGRPYSPSRIDGVRR